MFDRFKNLKLVQKIKETVSPKSRLQEYTDKALDKSTTDYLESISGVNMFSDRTELEAMVRAQLKEEFPGIENKKSYQLLVDAVIKKKIKKQLQADINLDIED